MEWKFDAIDPQDKTLKRIYIKEYDMEVFKK